MPPSAPRSAAVLGAGISGLTLAHALARRGVDVTLYERDRQPGGVIQTHHEGGWTVEEGPNTLLVRRQSTWDLLEELDLTERISRPGPGARTRYIVRDGVPCAVPMSLGSLLTSRLLSASAKLRLLKEPFIASPSTDDESIARFIRRRLGPEPLDYAVNPFVSGIYAGDPEALSVKHTFGTLFEMEQQHGSLLRGMMKRKKPEAPAERALISFREGLQELPQALARALGERIELGTEVQNIRREGGSWQLTLRREGSPHRRKFQAVVSTIPLHSQGSLWDDERSGHPFSRLEDVRYVPMSVLGLGFRRSQVHHPLDGFGMLVPQKEPFTLLGCLFSSSLFDGRAPDDHVLLSCFIGGARHPERAATSTDQLIGEIVPQLRRLLDIKGDPVFHHHHFWPHAIPQYTVGYDRQLQSMEQIEKANPGFFMAGNYRDGVSVPDRIEAAERRAEKVARYLWA